MTMSKEEHLAALNGILACVWEMKQPDDLILDIANSKDIKFFTRVPATVAATAISHEPRLVHYSSQR